LLLKLSGVMQMIAQPAPQIRVFALLITMLAMVACGSPGPALKSDSVSSPGERAALAALEQVGAPYRYGGDSPHGFDCSGLVQYSYGHAGVAVPRTTRQLWSVARTVERGDLRVGDLLFFSIEGKMSHVGMYLGEQRFVHAPQSGRRVSVASLDLPFYRAALLRAGRIY
jgi:cell wall-associated NlpC family hydrolase